MRFVILASRSMVLSKYHREDRNLIRDAILRSADVVGDSLRVADRRWAKVRFCIPGSAAAPATVLAAVGVIQERPSGACRDVPITTRETPLSRDLPLDCFLVG
jgi:hypothetical protein